MQPATHNIPEVSNESSVKEHLTKISFEMSNAARLLSLNSSSGNFLLKTFLLATESAMVQEERQDLPEGTFKELRHCISFQAVTKLQNFMRCIQVRDMRKCYLRGYLAREVREDT